MADVGTLTLDIKTTSTDTVKLLDSIIDRLNVLEKRIDNIGGEKRKKNTLGGLLNLSKWTSAIYSARKLGTYINKIVQAGADYTETLNLWEVAMSNNLSVATEFVDKMNEAYGISEETLMNAQAIFKNMLGSLGEISDSMAYSLSEGITQMALDYASLYNQSFEDAFTKFEAALAGQVRPIRSVSGYDITENTLYQLYQSLGGEKTMRQLSRTEKQLLSILAIFNQMSASGAIGDLEKTMGSFANQSRVFSEALQEVLTYSGVLLTYWLETKNVLVYVNAVLIFIGEVLKAVANDMGAIKHFSDPFASTTDGALEASDAIDEVQGKLLDFDKFRSLSSGQEDTSLSLDSTLLSAMSGYTSILGNASMEARELAESWKEVTFWTNGAFDKEKFDEVLSTLKNIGTFIAAISTVKFGVSIVKGISKMLTPLSLLLLALGYLYVDNEKFRNSINNLASTIGSALYPVLQDLGDLFVTISPYLETFVDVIGKALGFIADIIAVVIEWADENDFIEPTLIAIGVALATWKLGSVLTHLLKIGGAVAVANPELATMAKTTKGIGTTLDGIASIAAGVVLIIDGIIKICNGEVVNGLFAIAGGLIAVALGITLVTGGANNIPVIITAIVAAVAAATAFIIKYFDEISEFFMKLINTIANAFISFVNWMIDGINSLLAPFDAVSGVFGVSLQIPKWDKVVDWGGVGTFADGGLPDRGTLFVAGEAGAEMVYNMPSGQSGVANIAQIKSAFYQALVEYGKTNNNSQPIVVYLDGEVVYQNTTARAIQRGNVWSKA